MANRFGIDRSRIMSWSIPSVNTPSDLVKSRSKSWSVFSGNNENTSNIESKNHNEKIDYFPKYSLDSSEQDQSDEVKSSEVDVNKASQSKPVINNAKPTKSVRERYNAIRRSEVRKFSNIWNEVYGKSGKDLLSETIEEFLNSGDINKKTTAQYLIIKAARLRYLFSLNSSVNDGEIGLLFQNLGSLCENLGIQIDDMLKFMKNGSYVWSASVPRHLREILWENFGILDRDVQDWLKAEYAFESDSCVGSSKTKQLETERLKYEKSKYENHCNKFMQNKINNDELETNGYLEASPAFSLNVDYLNQSETQLTTDEKKQCLRELIINLYEDVAKSSEWSDTKIINAMKEALGKLFKESKFLLSQLLISALTENMPSKYVNNYTIYRACLEFVSYSLPHGDDESKENYNELESLSKNEIQFRLDVNCLENRIRVIKGFNKTIDQIRYSRNINQYTLAVTKFLDGYVKHHRRVFLYNQKLQKTSNAKRCKLSPVAINLDEFINHRLYEDVSSSLQDRLIVVNIDPLSDGINLDVMTGAIGSNG